jgi:hypothetical protein
MLLLRSHWPIHGGVRSLSHAVIQVVAVAVVDAAVAAARVRVQASRSQYQPSRVALLAVLFPSIQEELEDAVIVACQVGQQVLGHRR